MACRMSETPETAFVLAAGLGTRMRPLTDHVPKPLVPLAGRPLIDHVLARLAGAGVLRAVVNVHHHADRLEAHLRARAGAPAVTVSDERARLLNVGGGVVKARALLGLRPFFVHNSDSVWIERGASNLRALAAAFDAARMDCLLLCVPVAAAVGYVGPGDFHLAADGRLTGRSAGPDAPLVYAGVQIMHPRLLDDLPAGPLPMSRLWARAAGRMYGHRLDGLWLHVGSPGELATAEAVLAREAGHG
jgi:MurNAc alpha-1-phosphate uridylyltransferase